MNLHALDLIQLILDLRPDLKRRYVISKQRRQYAFIRWLIASGGHEYPALYSHPSIRCALNVTNCFGGLTCMQELVWADRADVQQVFKLPKDILGYIEWFYMHGVGEHRLWHWLTELERQRVLSLSGPWKSTFLKKSTDELLDLSSRPTPSLDQGVNLIGYVHGQLGIGEDVRMAVRAFDAAGVPLSLVNFPPGRDIPQNEISLAQRVVEEGNYSVNIFCLTALEHGRFYVERGATQFERRYNIGYWPWELSEWPNEWRQLLYLVDEIWVSTAHIAEAVSPYSLTLNPPVKVRCMPMAVPVDVKRRSLEELQMHRLQTREYFGLPPRACLFCYSFDLNSSIHRKNPEAGIKAFLKAFPNATFGREQVGLVIKVHPSNEPNKAWDSLKKLVGLDSRIHIVEQTLPRSALLSVYQACDAFLSLHRAEGFGRAIAEALQLGLRVIATDYSGNVDFCSRHEFAGRVKGIPYRLVKVKSGQYPFGKGQVWASPNIGAAAVAMRRVNEEVRESQGHLLPVPEGGWPVFSPEETGARYLKRLEEIRAEICLL